MVKLPKLSPTSLVDTGILALDQQNQQCFFRIRLRVHDIPVSVLNLLNRGPQRHIIFFTALRHSTMMVTQAIL